MPIVTPPLGPVARDFVLPEYGSWFEAVKDAVRDPAELCRLLAISPAIETKMPAAAGEFPLFVPKDYLSRIERGNPADPLLLQVLPQAAEASADPAALRDPVGDQQAALTPGLLHKYPGRVLLVTTGACAVHCRYCFRRHFPYAEAPKSIAAWRPALERIAADESIAEVILSGGDPLMLVDSTLAALVEHLERIGHLRRLRIHTRLPVMIPQRVTDSLLETIRRTRLAGTVVVHINHPAEINGAVADALRKLADAGVILLNQSVLLRGVNDDVDALAELMERLIELRVMPYYLHQLDRVTGAAHFEVPVEMGRQLIAALRTRLPGYAVPRYVQELAGHPHKKVLA